MAHSDAEQQPQDQLADLSTQVGEMRKQLIKTSNILGNLSAEVKAVARAQQQERRGLTLNSAVAYVLFVVLVAAGFYFLYHSQVERLGAEKIALVREHEAALTKLSAMHTVQEQRQATEARAAAFYRLSQSGQVHKALTQYKEVAQLPLSQVEAAVFQDWVSGVKSRLGYAAYTEGMQAVGEKEWKRAMGEFKSSLSYLPHPPHEASLRYYYGIAMMKLGSYKEASAELEHALAAGAEKVVSREIRFHMGTIYEQSARRDRAITAYKSYIKHHPATPYARAARRRLKALE